MASTTGGLLPETVTVQIAGDREYLLTEPTHGELLAIQKQLEALDQRAREHPAEESLCVLRMVGVVMAAAPGWQTRYPDDDALLTLRPSDSVRVMKAWQQLVGAGEEGGDGPSFRGDDR